MMPLIGSFAHIICPTKQLILFKMKFLSMKKSYIDNGQYIPDSHQLGIIRQFERLKEGIERYHVDNDENNHVNRKEASDNFASNDSIRLRGMYLYGSVGTGDCYVSSNMFNHNMHKICIERVVLSFI